MDVTVYKLFIAKLLKYATTLVFTYWMLFGISSYIKDRDYWILFGCYTTVTISWWVLHSYVEDLEK